MVRHDPRCLCRRNTLEVDLVQYERLDQLCFDYRRDHLQQWLVWENNGPLWYCVPTES